MTTVKFYRIIRNIFRKIKLKTNAIRHSIFRDSAQLHDIHFMFIATLPNSGSTALAMMLASAPRVVTLNKTAEGQWLIPEMRREGKRWDADYKLDYANIRLVWLDVIANIGLNPCLVVEKSPPNLCRMPDILRAFADMNPKVIIYVRNPYAVCASWASRYSREQIVREWYPKLAGKIDSDESFYRTLGKIYGERAEMMIALREVACMTISYEEMTEQTEAVVERLKTAFPLLSDVNPGTSVQVKDYASQPLQNMNDKQIDNLSPEQVEWISEGLLPYEDTIMELGYSLRGIRAVS